MASDRGCVKFWVIVFIYGPTMTFAAIAILTFIGFLTKLPNPTQNDWIAFIGFTAGSIFWFFVTKAVARYFVSRLR